MEGWISVKLCRFFGRICYPLCIKHYPLVYLYTAWVTRAKVPAALGAIWGVVLLLVALTVAYVCLKVYDEPVREWLGRRFLRRARASAAMQG